MAISADPPLDKMEPPSSSQGKNGETYEVEEVMTDEDEKRLVRKIDMHILPLMFVSYLLQYLDKTTLGYAAILGVIKDVGLVQDQYSWVSSSFYFGYLVASYPASFGFIKFPLGKYLSITIIVWGGILACHGATHNFVQLTTVRVLLGIFESTITPGFTLITSIWYKPSEHPLRTSLWFAGNATGAIFGGVLAYAMGHIKGSVAPWRWLFIIFGIITSVWGVLLLIFLADTPLTARWLSTTERAYANRRPQVAQKSFKSKKWQKDQCVEAFIDPKTWIIFCYTVLICLPNGGITNFNSIIVKGFGFTTFQTLLVGMPLPAITLVLTLVNAYIATKYRRMRCNIMAISTTIAIMGVLLVRLLPKENKWGRLVGIWFFGAFGAGFPMCLSIVASNFAGYTKKSTVAAILFIGYCAGNIGGPLMFKAKDAPGYNSAFAAILVSLALAAALSIVLRFYMDWENKRRNRKQGVVIEAEPRVQGPVLMSEEMLDGAEVNVSDWENQRFRYYL